ncbi:MAG: MerR family transcriptional regulator [Cyanobacteria bacterium P01_G01_bin.19]
MDYIYTKQEIASTLGVTPKTISNYTQYLNIKPLEESGKSNRYTEEQFQLIKQLRSHVAADNEMKTFVPQAINIEVQMDDEPAITKMPSPDGGLATTKEFDIEDLIIGSYLENLKQDPLYNLVLLERISQHNWSVSTKLVALMLNRSPKSFSGREKFGFCGFTITRIDLTDDIQRGYTWLVTK